MALHFSTWEEVDVFVKRNNLQDLDRSTSESMLIGLRGNGFAESVEILQARINKIKGKKADVWNLEKHSSK